MSFAGFAELTETQAVAYGAAIARAELSWWFQSVWSRTPVLESGAKYIRAGRRRSAAAGPYSGNFATYVSDEKIASVVNFQWYQDAEHPYRRSVRPR